MIYLAKHDEPIECPYCGEKIIVKGNPNQVTCPSCKGLVCVGCHL
ncbi:IBR domain-containing protein [Sulfuricurvum sp.]